MAVVGDKIAPVERLARSLRFKCKAIGTRDGQQVLQNETILSRAKKKVIRMQIVNRAE